MPTWDEILREIKSAATKIDDTVYFNTVMKYVNEFAEYRNRNVIIYYSDWLNNCKSNNVDINDSDMVGFMNAVHGLSKEKGLDLILHTPGGEPNAAESIVNYLHSYFGNDIEIFVPHMAMSAGTMISCASKTIWMGKQSSLGPVDPQFGRIACFNIKKEFEDAKQDLLNDPNSFRYWQIILSKYNQADYYTVSDAINLSSKLVKQWLKNYMFENDKNSGRKANNVAKKLNVNTGSHKKHFNQNECINIGLNVTLLESNSEIQDKVLSIYHCLQIFGSSTNFSKIIVNNLGKNYIVNNGIK